MNIYIYSIICILDKTNKNLNESIDGLEFDNKSNNEIENLAFREDYYRNYNKAYFNGNN